jgi:predicted xylose isomerase-like sugar epimerase
VPFKLLIDTFHHHLYPQAADEFSQVVADIGLVHLSGWTIPVRASSSPMPSASC